MLFTTHSLVGAALGSATGNPYAGFLGGFLSHHLMDALPHFDQGSFRVRERRALYLGDINFEENTIGTFGARDWAMLFIDWLVSLILFAIIFISSPPEQWGLIIIGALGGILPDVVDSSPLWSIKLREKIPSMSKYNDFHGFFHWTVPAKKWPLGMLTQILLIAASLWYLVF
ncbi:hypothetical protein A3G55_01285 [Candidatus Giovannonibacteria bacterium RIFCSPLOWO2_12_FULL_44_25]|uniref:Uncharacterized protein n=1 Tax=Candidatus Giovannonibacteria bacterium RIFCSPHIGHO2_02_FULL_45_40 TaxID=1798337 RepID=A0A1F5W8Y8_9BACT|nr:MAG: hypothetical protein UW15_C0030G0009 [Parcubacteria group bacterium GW2011_GWC1_44_10]OGF50556.1 MAG: hypothetical protein A2120_03980 [Candidatus Giovannonibacteria bacterium GWA2_45_15]OGF60306.1 MAG: hypothetical protein A2W40_04035 [Candidatus Giovannonibacteria bacterium RIFCSPHIGHO2_01_45_12]OGF60957.1 MAG: hypothetical protein A2656_01735 [Candidatus Giovannonibacteria bacterium RIFCSPHIGHO2_01_FULL_44_100]OGF72132.1 MAG: hypothetical protein A3C05_02805 [Candidatus Giovannonibac